MDKETWRKYVVEDNKGAFVLWIDQSTEPLLKVNNSKGVCFAMAIDFVTAYQLGQPGPRDFVNEIRNRSLVWPYTSRIPPKYLDIQTGLEAMTEQFKKNLRVLVDQLKKATKEDKPAIRAKILKFKDDRLKQFYGPGMQAVEEFEEDNMLAGLEIFDRLKATATKNGPSYFIVEMHDADTAHAIAFGFRPDLSASSNFPGIYEFFDANLGFFVFGTEDRLMNFFCFDVWLKIYTEPPFTNYTKFYIASFTAKNGKR
ncbi:hypothetical protein FAM09_16775 [Niastella caeni]|uniref:Peptidase C58 YopT-type domain-containing protein n=1 Tax=Niastella caeni TaxID=2569763 RepID=A0A4S8HUK7_9BACT|nr:hypothetical protein [Niastella caeni]THU38329.1 hypothetical protein FAM09_16775 [Niastella caeni]